MLQPQKNGGSSWPIGTLDPPYIYCTIHLAGNDDPPFPIRVIRKIRGQKCFLPRIARIAHDAQLFPQVAHVTIDNPNERG